MAASKMNAIVVDSPVDLRNVVLVGSAGSGKTTLFEHLLRARSDGYRGEKDGPERASALTLARIPSGDVVINILDAPGHPDYVGELRAGLRAADAAVFVVSAADGIDGITTSLWRECAAVKMPRAIVITKLDAGRATFEDMVHQCREAFGEGVVPAYMPLKDGDDIVGNLSMVTLRCHDYSSGAVSSSAASDAQRAQIEEFRSTFIEGLITEADDDELMERYLEGDELKRDALLDDLHTAVAQGSFYPVIPIQTHNGTGTEELLGMIERGFPNPCMVPLPRATTPDLDDLDAGECSADAPLLAEVVRTSSDQFAGRLSMVRVFAGTLTPDSAVHVSGHRATFTGKDDEHHPDHDIEERVGQLSTPAGGELVHVDHAVAGDIVFVSKLAVAETSDTISGPERPALIEPWVLPDPLLPMAIRAETRNDEDKLAGALQRLGVEDTTVRLAHGDDSDQLILWTMGQAHADLLLARLKERYGVSVTSEPVRIALRETFTTKAIAKGRHVKQSGGHGQYAVCDVEIEPAPRGTGFEFVDKVVGGAVPRQFIPSVEKGLRQQMEKGVIAGYPMVDIRVTLVDGKAHSVDSSDMAFQLAGQLALKEAASAKTCTLLEPVDEVQITVGEEYQGAIMTDLSNRRGRVVGTDMPGDGSIVISAHVPQQELSRYAIDLRGLAQGTGAFTREFFGYEEMPRNLVEEAMVAAE